jgi:hypothetical protein
VTSVTVNLSANSEVAMPTLSFIYVALNSVPIVRTVVRAHEVFMDAWGRDGAPLLSIDAPSERTERRRRARTGLSGGQPREIDDEHAADAGQVLQPDLASARLDALAREREAEAESRPIAASLHEGTE